METSNIENLVLETCKKQGWKISPKDDLLNATEELGEIAREIRRYENGRERPDEIDPSKEVIKKNISEEIGDLLFVIVKISHHYGITLEEAFMTHHNKLQIRYSKDKQEDK